MIVSRTPFRISLFGGGTDYPAWYRLHGGAVLAAAIDKYCYLSCRRLPPFFEHRIRVVYSQIENCRVASDVQHPAVRAVLAHLGISSGVEIHHDGDLPARSGMGSSSAFTVGLLHALYALLGERPDAKRLALESIALEQDVMREMVGSQDQVTAAYGGVNHITFGRDGSINVRPMNVPAPRLEDLNRHLMLFYTGIQRTSSDVAESYGGDAIRNDVTLRRTLQLVEEAVGILTGSTPISELGPRLDEAWRLKCTFSPLVTNDAVSAFYDTARRAGATGGKLTGAGGGGFLLLFVPPDRHDHVRTALHPLVQVPFGFDFTGSRIVMNDSAPVPREGSCAPICS